MIVGSVAIGDICNIVGGGTPARDVAAYYGGSIPWVTPKDMKTWEIKDAQVRITQAGLDNSATRLVPADSVLVVVRSGVLKHTVPVAIARVPVAINQDMKAFICSESVDPRYLARFIKVRSPVILQWVRATTADNLPVEKLKQLRIDLPTPSEQRRIAQILDKADALRTKRRAAIARLDTLAQSIFLDMFGDPATNPKGWPDEPLTTVCHCYSGGTPSKDQPMNWRGKLPWFTPKDLKMDDLFDSEDHIHESIPEQTPLRLLPAGTVAIVVRGMILAHTFPVSVLRVPCTINQDLKALLPRKAIEPQFLANCVRAQSSGVLARVSESAHGTKRIDGDSLAKIRVPIVPHALQIEFESRVASLEAMGRRYDDSQSNHELLFASLQNLAFRGGI